MKRRSMYAAAAVVAALGLAAPAGATDIYFRSFSGSATMGPQAKAYAAKLKALTSLTLGDANQVNFVALPGVPAIPSQFGGNVVAAVAAGSAGGGFDAAYNSGSELNKAWGFLYNSGMPGGLTFDEFLGFLYGKSVNNGQQTGLELIQSIMDARNRNVVVIPVVGSSEQLSGYFPLPIGEAPGQRGIGLAGLCEQPWTLRYLPPGENVLNKACDTLLASGQISAKNLRFIAAIPGGGSLVDAVKTGALQGFEFATPLDDKSQFFGVDNPGTVGVRYVHFPGWQQQFLVTWMIVNKQVWDGMTPQQQELAKTVARDHVVSSYGENMRQQGDALSYILDVNRHDADPDNDIVLVEWPRRDLEQIRDATIAFLNERTTDTTLSWVDREDYVTVLEAMRKYVRASDKYWDHREGPTRIRFQSWTDSEGQLWYQDGRP